MVETTVSQGYAINYADCFSKGSRGEVLLALAVLGGEARFTKIAQVVGRRAKSTIDYNLRVLERGGFVTRSVGGLLRLRYCTPLCLIAGCKDVGYAYLGLLGERGGREESETETALSILKDQWHISPDKIAVLTTRRAAATWGTSPKPNIEWILLDDEDISDVSGIFEAAEPKVRELAAGYRLVMDCTSATKPATIAFYKLALKYYAPLVYVYEQSKKLVWIISVEDLQRQLFGDKVDQCLTLLKRLSGRKESKNPAR